MNTKDFYYDLPEELIAQKPLKNRDESRLMLFDRVTGKIKHERFFNLAKYLTTDDVLVLNNTKVLPARLYGEKPKTGARVEILLLKRISLDTWEILAKPAKRLKEDTVCEFAKGKLHMTVIEEKAEGIRIVKFSYQGVFETILEEYGSMPLPPYIKEKLEDKDRYQTVYSQIKGSSAAPTAGLHFTEKLLQEIADKGVQIEKITLHVGLGTFRPVKEEKIENHIMHKEHYIIAPDVKERLNKAKKSGKNIVAVGTTTVRTLESSSAYGQLENEIGDTDIFIYPGFEFTFVDKLITNFHLPCSTLIMMISAFSKRELVLDAYQKAIDEKYRFFSFGDAMFLGKFDF